MDAGKGSERRRYAFVVLRALTEPRWRVPAVPDILAVLVAAIYCVTFIEGELGHRGPLGRYTFFLPLVLLPLALIRRHPLSRAQGVSLMAMAIVPLAGFSTLLVSFSWVTAVAIPAMAVVTLLVARFPAAALAGVFICASFHATIKLYTPIAPQKAGDVLLVGLWIVALWKSFVSPAPRPRISIWPGVACVGIFVVLSAFEIMTARTFTIGLQSFRVSGWYLAVVLLIAYAPWPDATRRRMENAILALIVLTAGYATWRWAGGPTADEAALAKANINNIGSNGIVRPIGSFNTAKELASWTGVAVPFAVGIALTLKSRWRLVAGAGAALAFIAMFSTGVRAAPAAAGPGLLAVLVLYQLSQSYRGRRGATVAIIGLSALLAGAGGYALTSDDDPDTANRYRAILDPASDQNYQARLIKWREALDDIDNAPFGHGLGTAGVAQKRFGEFTNIGSNDVDNSYIKVAYEQGFVVAVFFTLSILLLLLGLARRALVALEPARAGPALAACGTIVALLILFFIGTYVEGVAALAGWMMVGFGVSRFTRVPRAATAPASASADAERVAPGPIGPPLGASAGL
jgi:O-Antigen ligase